MGLFGKLKKVISFTHSLNETFLNQSENVLCTTISFNNLIKAYFFNKKVIVLIQDSCTQIENNIFTIHILVLIRFSKVIGVYMQLFDTALLK